MMLLQRHGMKTFLTRVIQKEYISLDILHTPLFFYLEKYGYDYKLVAKNMTEVDVNNEIELEKEFWLWSTGWGNDN